MLLCEQCERGTSSIDSTVEGCARGISFSRIEASSATLDRHLDGIDGVPQLAVGMRQHSHVVDMRMQLTDTAMHTRNLTSTWQNAKCFGPRCAKVWSRFAHVL